MLILFTARSCLCQLCTYCCIPFGLWRRFRLRRVHGNMLYWHIPIYSRYGKINAVAACHLWYIYSNYGTLLHTIQVNVRVMVTVTVAMCHSWHKQRPVRAKVGKMGFLPFMVHSCFLTNCTAIGTKCTIYSNSIVTKGHTAL